jgi:23S rRNA (uracil1939-C5)-methyltransferase
MCGLQFQVSPHSFFQTNTAQAERLYQLAVQAAAEAVGACSYAAVAGDAASQATAIDQQQQLDVAGVVGDAGARVAAVGTGLGVILDLYCGTGTIALCLAAALPAQQVVGFDVSASSIADATANAARNHLVNVSFVCGDLNQLLPEGSGAKQRGKGAGRQQGRTGNKQFGRQSKQQAAPGEQQGQPAQLQQLRPQVVVVDPARAGLGAGVVQYLMQCGAQRVVYVSCNAATQARDLQLLCGKGVFTLSSWQCVDLFPQTDVAHVETVVVLDRAG